MIKKEVKWSVVSMCTVIILSTASPEAYHVLKKNHYPFPASSTLKKCAIQVIFHQGILPTLLFLVKRKT